VTAEEEWLAECERRIRKYLAESEKFTDRVLAEDQRWHLRFKSGSGESLFELESYIEPKEAT